MQTEFTSQVAGAISEMCLIGYTHSIKLKMFHVSRCSTCLWTRRISKRKFILIVLSDTMIPAAKLPVQRE